MVVTDFDNDGDLDIVSSGKIDYKLYWLENKLIDCPRSFALGTDSICRGDSLAFGGAFIHAAGLFRDTLVKAAGCDSIVGLELNMLAVPQITVSEAGLVVSASAGFSNHQWFLNGIALPNETSASVDANTYGTGDYSVEANAPNGCGSVSSALFVDVPDAIRENNGRMQLRTVPNPTSGQFYVELPSSTYSNIRLRTLQGTEISREAYHVRQIGNQLRFQLGDGVPSGLLMLELQASDPMYYVKVLLQ